MIFLLYCLAQIIDVYVRMVEFKVMIIKAKNKAAASCSIALFFSLFACLLIAGCATSTVSSSAPAPVSWDVQKQSLSALTSWQIRGRVAIKPTDPSLGESFSANLFWRQLDQNYDIELFGPIGLGAIKLLGQPGTVTLTDSQGHKYQARSPESLMQQQLNWSLPISQLYYWVRGLPAPNNKIDKRILDPQHRLLVLEQDGWKISYQSYRYINKVWLPKKIVLQAETLKVVLVINDMVALKG